MWTIGFGLGIDPTVLWLLPVGGGIGGALSVGGVVVRSPAPG